VLAAKKQSACCIRHRSSRAPLLFCDHPARGRWRRCRGRDGKCQPCVPAGGPIRTAKFCVGLEIDVTLKALAERDDVAKLRSDAEHLRLEASDAVAGAAVAADFLLRVAYQANLNLLGQELRRAPIEVQVDATLILCCGIDEIIGKPKHT
jgi:hypothetical protein